jgi:hypothetical protein
MKLKNISRQIICAVMAVMLVPLSGCAQVRSLIDEAKNSFVLDPGDDYNAQDDLDKMMAELSMAASPNAGKLHPVNVMENEPFQVGWDRVKDATEYAVEIKVNGVSREPFITMDTMIDVLPADEGGEVIVSVIARRKMTPISGEAYYVESPALNISVGVYSIKMSKLFVSHFKAVAQNFIQYESHDTKQIKNDLKIMKQNEILSEVLPWHWNDLILDTIWKTEVDCQKDLVKISEQYWDVAKKHAAQVNLWADAITNESQELNAATIDAFREHVVGMRIHLSTAKEWVQPVEDAIDAYYANALKSTMEAFFRDKLDVALFAGELIGLPNVMCIELIDTINALSNVMDIQTKFEKVSNKIEQNFNANYHTLTANFNKYLKDMS